MDAVNKAAPVLASSKVEGPAAPKPASAAQEDTEMKKVMEDCKRLQTEMSKLQEENRQLKVTPGHHSNIVRLNCVEFILHHFETAGIHNSMKSEWFMGSQQFKMSK